jgi:2-keto-3-deoxy-L-rhamnonate aldolase RhmA
MGNPGQENRVKRVFRQNGLALAAYTGGFSDPSIVELIGHAGFDAAFIDMEHTAVDLPAIQVMALAAKAAGVTSVVRPPGFQRELILRLLDIGVEGIYVPHVANVAEAQMAIDSVRYPPLGHRGMNASSRATRFGRTPLGEHMARSNREVLLAVMIEDETAMDDVSTIARLDGLDLVAVGPSDLASALGVAGQRDHPKLLDAIRRIAEAVIGSGNARLGLPANHPLFPRSPTQLRDMGVSYANCGPTPEVRLLRSLSEQIESCAQQGSRSQA